MADQRLRGWRSVWVGAIAASALTFSLLSCNSGQTYPLIKPDVPIWLQSTSPKTFTATVKHPDLAAWEILGPKVTFQVGSQPAQVGSATLGPNGSLSFSIPSGQDGDLRAFKTVTFAWTAQARLRNGQDQVDIEAQGPSFVIGCLPNDLGRKGPLDNVANSSRLNVQNPCVTFSGTVQGKLVESARTLDGDTHLWIRPDPGFETFLQPPNLGKMVGEIVPADKPSCVTAPVIPPDNSLPLSEFGSCTHADIADPDVGSHITITGPLVVDVGEANWAEIHPIWSIALTPPPPLLPTPPLPSRNRHSRK